MISPESIRVADLPSVPLHNRKELPAKPCIYFAIDNQGAIQYIGASVNLRKRWRSHHRYPELASMDGVTIAYVEVAASVLKDVESDMIRWFHPELNSVGGWPKNVPRKDGDRSNLIRVEVPIEVRETVRAIAAEHGTVMPEVYRWLLASYKRED